MNKVVFIIFFTVSHGTFSTPVGLKSRYWKFGFLNILLIFFISGQYIYKIWLEILGILMGTNCAPLVADLFLFCYERDFMLSLSDNNQTDIIEAF